MPWHKGGRTSSLAGTLKRRYYVDRFGLCQSDAATATTLSGSENGGEDAQQGERLDVPCWPVAMEAARSCPPRAVPPTTPALSPTRRRGVTGRAAREADPGYLGQVAPSHRPSCHVRDR